MKSFFLTLRLWAYQYGLQIKPEYLIPPARLYKSNPPKLPPVLKRNDVPLEHRVKTKQEFQANLFLYIANEYYNRKQTQKAQENLDKALSLAKSAAEDEFSSDFITELYYLRGYIMLQKKKLMPAYLNFKIFLKLRAQYSKPYTIQDARVRLELAKILIFDRKIPGLDASIENIMGSLADKTDPEQLYILANCHRALSEYHFSIGNPDTAIANGVKCLEVLEAPELKNSYFGKEIPYLKLELAKVFVKLCEDLALTFRSYLCKDTLPKIAKLIQENKAELGARRGTFAFILPKLFELSVKFVNNKEFHQEIFGILQEAKFEEKDFSSKSEYIGYILSVADGMLILEHYTEGSELLNKISEELDNCQVSSEVLGRYFYLKSQYADENKNYQEVLYYKRLYQETRPEEKHFYQSWNPQDLMCYIVGIKANVKLQKLDEAIEEVPLYLNKCYGASEKSNIDDGSRTDLREFLAKNIEDIRWEKWLKEAKDDEKETPVWMSRNRENFVRLNMLMLCAKNKQFSLAEDCAAAIKKSGASHHLPAGVAKKSDFIICSSVVKDCIELIEEGKGMSSYLNSLIEIIPIFSRRKLLRGNVFILEEIEQVLQSYSNISLPLMVKLQTIKAIVYYDLGEWSDVAGFLAETVSRIEQSNYVDDFVPVTYNLYGHALLESGRGSQKEGAYYLEKGRKIYKELLSQEDKFKKQNLDGYNLIIDPQKQEPENKAHTVMGNSGTSV